MPSEMSIGGNTVIKLSRPAVWACAIFLAVAFVLVGISKLEGPSAMRWTDRFAQWGYPASAQYVIGVLEIFGGLGVLIPRWRRAAAAILIALMIGALCTHPFTLNSRASFRRLSLVGSRFCCTRRTFPAKRAQTSPRGWSNEEGAATAGKTPSPTRDGGFCVARFLTFLWSLHALPV
jgi:uncharacterized membrane protein YphA (DoxX/SURF4 family)